MVKVTVIVAVYNPGRNVDQLLESFDAQTMSPDEFEVIFADDDSTDGSRERLQEWAGTRPNVSVLHNTPNSGWPGRPRNLGIDAAQGEYVFFADNDDKLAPDALRAMYDYATAHRSDVVIAKEVGVGPGRGVPCGLFRRNIPDAKLGVDPILGILTPHKLVRTAMVREHGIRFPEGKVRLEDHFFIISCFFAAQRISVLADTLCYYWMRREDDVDNASFQATDPALYYASVERVLEVVESNTHPGDFRDKLYSHWFTSKMLDRLRGGSLLKHPEQYQEQLFDELRRVSERFGFDERLLPYLGAGARARAQLLWSGTLEDIRILGEAERGVTSRTRLIDAHWTNDDQLELTLRSDFVYRDGSPIVVEPKGGRLMWDPTLIAHGLRLEPIDVTDLVARTRVNLLLSNRDTLDLSFAEGRSHEVSDGRVGAMIEATIDPNRLFTRDGPPAKCTLDLRTRLTGLGWSSETRTPVTPGVDIPGARVIATPNRVRLYATKKFGNLSIEFTPGMGRRGDAVPSDSADAWQSSPGEPLE